MTDIDICDRMNQNCIVKSCCSQMCDDVEYSINLKRKISCTFNRRKLKEITDHTITSNTCYFCGRVYITTSIYQRGPISKDIYLTCIFCETTFRFIYNHSYARPYVLHLKSISKAYSLTFTHDTNPRTLKSYIDELIHIKRKRLLR